jgi:hypothetical protein
VYTDGYNLSSGLEAETLEALKKSKKLPTRIDWISGNPKDGRSPDSQNQDYTKVIYEVKDDLTIASPPGTIVKGSNGKYYFSGTFRNAKGEIVPADKLTDEDKKMLQADLEQERSNLMNKHPDKLASLVKPPLSSNVVTMGCNNDADNDGIQNGWDNCPNTFNPDQADSQGNGTGDVCRTILMCDTDRNGVIDLFDIGIITVAQGLPADQFQLDPRDPDGDRWITTNDAQICRQRCSHPDCAPL